MASHTTQRRLLAEKLAVPGIRRGFFDVPLSAVLGALFFLLLLVENPIEPYVPGLNYLDELIFIMSTIAAIVLAGKRRIDFSSEQAKIAIIAILMLLIGLVGNVINPYQRNIVAIVSEAVAFLKAPITLVSILVILKDRRTDDLLSCCCIVAKVFVIVCFVFCCLNLVSPSTTFGYGVRNGITSFKFIYSHPTFLVFALVMCYVVLDANNRRIDLCKVLCLFVLAMTMRDKAIGFIAFVLASWIFGISKKKSVLIYAIGIGAIVLYVVWPKISLYMSYASSPREALYSTSFKMSLNCFPFGGGLASIASSLSGEYYSAAYSVYGLSSMIGLNPYDYADMGDAGFSYYLGQFGFVGFVLFVVILVLIYETVVKTLPPGSSRRDATLALLVYVMIALTVENVLTNASGASIAVLFGFVSGGSFIEGTDQSLDDENGSISNSDAIGE